MIGVWPRRTAAEAVDADMYEQFSMYHTAGLPDFGFMRKVIAVMLSAA